VGPVPLSEHELRALRDIERRLAEEDPLPAKMLSGPTDGATTDPQRPSRHPSW
jgi:hypothetical protein